MAAPLIFKTATRAVEVTEAALSFAEIEVHENVSAITLTTQNVYQQVADFTENGQSAGVTPDHTNDHITVVDGGDYFIHLAATISGSGSQTFELQVQKNNGGTPFDNVHVSRKLGAGGDSGSVMTAGIVPLSANDTVEVWARCTSGNNKSLTIEESTLIVIRVGD